MHLHTFRAGSLPEALQMVRVELGPDAAVLRTRSIWAGGLLGLFTRRRAVEVIASTSVDVPSRFAKRKAILDHGLDLTDPTLLGDA